MRSTIAILTLSLAACAAPLPAPPTAVEVRVPVPVPCQVDEPQCAPPAYDSARKDMPGDRKVKLLRAETIQREQCLAEYRAALAVCRKEVQ